MRNKASGGPPRGDSGSLRQGTPSSRAPQLPGADVASQAHEMKKAALLGAAL